MKVIQKFNFRDKSKKSVNFSEIAHTKETMYPKNYRHLIQRKLRDVKKIMTLD